MTSYLCGQPDAARIRERSHTGDDGNKRSDDMTVDRTQMGYQTRYTLRDGAALSCMLTFGAGEISAPGTNQRSRPGHRARRRRQRPATAIPTRAASHARGRPEHLAAAGPPGLR